MKISLPAGLTVAASPRRRVAASSGALWVPFWVALTLTACAQPVAKRTPAPADERVIAANWVNSTLAVLTLEEKVGQLLATRTMSDFRNASSADFMNLQHEIRDLHVGAVTVGIGSPPEIAAKVNALQRLAKVPLLISAHLENGGATIFPYPLGVAATGEPAFADTVARITAREARAVGINWLFAPVVETSSPTAVISVGSYGTDSATAARFASAYIHGAAVAGALTDALKTSVLKEAQAGAPGDNAVAAIASGSDMVSPPDLDAAYKAILAAVKSGRITPARVDASVRRILEAKAHVGLYKTRFVSLDSVAEIVAAPEHERAAALVAGRSLVLVRDLANVVPIDPRSHRSAAVIAFTSAADPSGGDALAAELRRIYGTATVNRLDESSSPDAIDAAIVRAEAADFVVFATFMEPVDGQADPRVPQRARTVAARLSAIARPRVTIAFGDPYASADLPGASTYMLAWQTRGAAAQTAAAEALAGIVTINGHLPVDVRGEARGTGITRTVRPYVLSFGRPEDVGMDPVRLARIDGIVNAAIADHASPGAAIAIGRYGRIVKMQGYGDVDYRAGFPAVTDSTMYDLASLTKVAGTTNAVMFLYDQGRLDLDAPISNYLAEWRAGPGCPEVGAALPAPAPDGNCRGVSAEKAGITVRQLLTHSAGLPAWAPLYASAHGRAQYINGIAALPLEYAPGTKSIYSDLSMIVVQAIVERIAGEPLDVFLQKRLFSPMGMRDTRFNPLRAPGEPDSLGCLAGVTPDQAVLARIAPTEISSRGVQIYGTVHDENACAIGGVSGHAGLFSSARDLAALSQMLLDDGFYAGHRLIRPATVDLFTSRQGERSSRALGWDTPTFGASNGDYFSEHSFGHTGFTGTSIWVDKEKHVFVVLLTNRVNPSQGNEKHLALRREVQDAVALAVMDMPVAKRPDVVQGEAQRALARAAAEKERRRALRARHSRHKSTAAKSTTKKSTVKKGTAKKRTVKKSTRKPPAKAAPRKTAPKQKPHS